MNDVDVVIVGAGPAGLAASLALAAAGLSVAHFEARDRIGGRTHTMALGGQPGVDVGAHWLHAGHTNPLMHEAKRLGISLNTSDKWPLVMDGHTTLGPWGQMKLWHAWRKIDKGIVRLADCTPGASAELAVNRYERWQHIAGELHGTHACGVPLSEVSAEDFANANDSEDRFVEGGYGALVAAAGATAKPTLGVTVKAVRQEGLGSRVVTTAGEIKARAVLMTIPATLIANGSIAFEPGLPEQHQRAARDLPHGAYERLVFKLKDDPFAHERDRAVILINDQNQTCYMMAGGGGKGVHFADFGGAEARELATKGMNAMADVVRGWLRAHLGEAVAKGLVPLHASGWSTDPLSLGAWSVARPGRAHARAELRAPIENRIWFAGEATSLEQWGTVGGAWLEGKRAAEHIRQTLQAVAGAGRAARLTESAPVRASARARKRPQNLT